MKVLIVDDEVEICRRLQRELKKEGCEVEYTTSPLEVIERLSDAKRQKMPYELLLLDLRMPGVDGFELLRRIRKAELDLDAIIITAYGDEDKAVEAVRLGAVDYLCKPISLEELHTAIFRVQQKRTEVAKKALRHRVLVVDDDKDICARIKRELDKEGYQTAVAYDGVESLDYFKNNRVDVVIADIKMPGMSGLELVRRCREINHDCVFIIITGYGDHETAIEALRLGVFNYLKKPVMLEEVIVSVNKGIELLLLQRGLSASRRELEIETGLKEQYAKKLEKMVAEKTKALRESEECYRSLIENIDLGITLIDTNYKIIITNAAQGRLFHKPASEFVGKECFREFEKREAVCQHCPGTQAIASRRPAEVETEGVRDDGSLFSVRIHAFPVFSSDGTVSGFIEVVEDITERKRTLETLKKLSSAIEQGADSVIITDKYDVVDYVNPAFEKLTGYTREEAIGKKPNILKSGKHDKKFYEKLYETIHSGRVYRGEIINKKKNGEIYLVASTITPIIDMQGNITHFVSTEKDITERKKAEEQLKASLKEKEILLREIHHRVKNNIQVISSLLSLQADRITEEKYRDMFKESQNRILAMSLIHEKLYQSKDFAKIDVNEYINDLVNDLFQYYGVNTGNITLNINVENVSMGIDSAIPCGLIINELVTNSLKHAFPDGRKGELKISLRSIGENMIELVISDNGIGIPKDLDFENTQSLGLYLVKILAETQLQGEIELDRSKGTEFKIKFKGEK